MADEQGTQSARAQPFTDTTASSTNHSSRNKNTVIESNDAWPNRKVFDEWEARQVQKRRVEKSKRKLQTDSVRSSSSQNDASAAVSSTQNTWPSREDAHPAHSQSVYVRRPTPAEQAVNADQVVQLHLHGVLTKVNKLLGELMESSDAEIASQIDSLVQQAAENGFELPLELLETSHKLVTANTPEVGMLLLELLHSFVDGLKLIIGDETQDIHRDQRTIAWNELLCDRFTAQTEIIIGTTDPNAIISERDMQIIETERSSYINVNLEFYHHKLVEEERAKEENRAACERRARILAERRQIGEELDRLRNQQAVEQQRLRQLDCDFVDYANEEGVVEELNADVQRLRARVVEQTNATKRLKMEQWIKERELEGAETALSMHLRMMRQSEDIERCRQEALRNQAILTQEVQDTEQLLAQFDAIPEQKQDESSATIHSDEQRLSVIVQEYSIKGIAVSEFEQQFRQAMDGLIPAVQEDKPLDTKQVNDAVVVETSQLISSHEPIEADQYIAGGVAGSSSFNVDSTHQPAGASQANLIKNSMSADKVNESCTCNQPMETDCCVPQMTRAQSVPAASLNSAFLDYEQYISCHSNLIFYESAN